MFQPTIYRKILQREECKQLKGLRGRRAFCIKRENRVFYLLSAIQKRYCRTSALAGIVRRQHVNLYAKWYYMYSIHSRSQRVCTGASVGVSETNTPTPRSAHASAPFIQCYSLSTLSRQLASYEFNKVTFAYLNHRAAAVVCVQIQTQTPRPSSSEVDAPERLTSRTRPGSG